MCLYDKRCTLLDFLHTFCSCCCIVDRKVLLHQNIQVCSCSYQTPRLDCSLFRKIGMSIHLNRFCNNRGTFCMIKLDSDRNIRRSKGMMSLIWPSKLEWMVGRLCNYSIADHYSYHSYSDILSRTLDHLRNSGSSIRTWKVLFSDICWCLACNSDRFQRLVCMFHKR